MNSKVYKVVSKIELKKVRGHDDIKYKYLIETDDNEKLCALYWNLLDKHVIVYESKYDDDICNSDWSINAGGYALNKTLGYMHSFVAALSKIINNETNPELSIDHINEYKLDNRSKNLRLATQSQQNANRCTRSDKNEPCEDLKNAGVTELPKYIRWDNSEKKFIIEGHPELQKEVRQGIRKKATMSGTKSTKLTVLQKYQDILARLDNLNENNKDTEEFKKLKMQNKMEYEEICRCVHEYNGISYDNEKEKIDNEIKIQRATIVGKKKESTLPDDCGIKHEDIPKYCYYTPKTEKRGDKFVIDKHPGLLKMGKRQWSTTERTSVSTLEKFQLLLEKYAELESISQNNSLST